MNPGKSEVEDEGVDIDEEVGRISTCRCRSERVGSITGKRAYFDVSRLRRLVASLQVSQSPVVSREGLSPINL